MGKMEGRQVFIMRPFRRQRVFAEDMIVTAIVEAGAVPLRVEDFPASASFVEEMYKVIETADLIVCDLSSANPNVMYELGYAHALLKPVVLVSESASDSPFDLRGARLLRYDPVSISGQSWFVHELAQAIVNALSNPSAYAGRPKTDSSVNGVFISYSHKDQDFLRRLMIHLRPLEKQGVVELWADSKLAPGDRWRDEIQRALKKARVAVLLVSADFLASDFIVDDELPPLLKQAETTGTRIVPVILKPCRYARDKHLSEFQAINDPATPMIRLSEAEQEFVYDRVAEVVEKALAGKAG